MALGAELALFRGKGLGLVVAGTAVLPRVEFSHSHFRRSGKFLDPKGFDMYGTPGIGASFGSHANRD